MKEIKDVYALELLVKTSSINLDNIDFVLKSIEMENEDEDVKTFTDRAYSISKERCSDGVKITLYIVNDGTSIDERLDYLVDEEYVVSKVNAEIKTKSTEVALEYELLNNYGTQTRKEVDIVVDPLLEEVNNYLVNNLTEGNECLHTLIFQTLEKDEYFQNILAEIIRTPLL